MEMILHCVWSRTSRADDAVRCTQSLGQMYTEPRSGRSASEVRHRERLPCCPGTPSRRLLLGMRWRGTTLVDGALPFGLRLAPKLFTVVADAFLWIMGRHGVVHGMHYLDNFLVLGPLRSDVCQWVLDNSLQLCDRLGCPVAPHKIEGPSSLLTSVISWKPG